MKQIEQIKQQEEKMLEATSVINIETPEDYEQVATLGKKLSAYIKNVDKKEKEITKPINDSLKNIRAMFKPFKETAENKKKEIKDAMAKYIYLQEEKRRKEEARITARVERGTMREDTAVNKLTSLEETKTDTAGTTTSVLTVTIDDIKLIPAEYLTVNESAIKQAYRQGVEVPGVTCKYETSIRL
jgi:glutamine synthetase adenylyltransferase